MSKGDLNRASFDISICSKMMFFMGTGKLPKIKKIKKNS